MSKHGKEIKRINWEIVKKIIVLLYYENKIKKTNIAMKCHLGYDKCLRYINWLDMMDLIKKDLDENRFEVISLSDKGIDFYSRKLNPVNTNSYNCRSIPM